MGIDSKPRLNWTKILSESNPSESSPWQQKSTKITFKMLSLTTETGGVIKPTLLPSYYL